MKAVKIKIDTTDNNVISKIIDKNLYTYLHQVLDIIIYAIDNDMLTIPVFEIEFTGEGLESNGTVVINYDREIWPVILNKLSQHFTELEEYEKCAIIRDYNKLLN